MCAVLLFFWGVCEMLYNFFSLPSHCAFGARSGIVCLHSLPCGKERSKKTPQRALPFGFPRCEAGAIDISAPRQKCLSTFFLGCENDPRYRFAASGNPKIPLLQGFVGCLSAVWQKAFCPNSPFFDMRGVSLLVLGIASLAQLGFGKKF